jgi:hypothetical protein
LRNSEQASSSKIDGLTGSIEPGKVFIHTGLSSGKRKGRGERGKGIEGGGVGDGEEHAKIHYSSVY